MSTLQKYQGKSDVMDWRENKKKLLLSVSLEKILENKKDISENKVCGLVSNIVPIRSYCSGQLYNGHVWCYI